MFLNFIYATNRAQSKSRDWSLITGRGGGGGATKQGGGGYVKFYPYEKGRVAEKVLAMLKGAKKFCGSFYAVA